MNKESGLTLGSLFDGSGGFPLAGILAGVTPLWASEIEPFAVRVTTKRLPQMKHYGDVSQMRGADLPPLTSSPSGAPARICLSLAEETVWMVHAPACSMKQFAS